MLLYQCPADGLHTVDQMIIMMVARLRTLQLVVLMVVHSLLFLQPSHQSLTWTVTAELLQAAFLLCL